MAVSRINEAGLNVNQYGNRNLVINGAMTIDQRNSGSVVTPSDSQKTLDRFMSDLSAASKFSVQQVTDSPTDFSNSLKVTSLSAYTPSSSDFFGIQQAIEGFNTAQLNLGTANAKVITLSFYVKSSLTGTFGGAFNNSAHNRSYPYTYTISAANTWERKTITLTGDTSGTWIGSTNGIGLRVFWSMGAGSGRINTAGAWVGSLALGATGQTNVVATNAATWQVTGVQLEVGDTATDFEHRSFGDELARCQRYFCRTYPYGTATGDANANSSVTGAAYATINYAGVPFRFPVEMRAAPTVQIYSTQNANTTGKVTSDGADGTGGTAFTGRTSTLLHRNNDSTGVVANAFIKVHVTAEAEL